MSKMPEFDFCPEVRPPRYKWWFTSLLVLLVLLGSTLPWGYLVIFMLPLSGFILGLWLVGFICVHLIYFSRERDALRFANTVEQLKLEWQARNRHKAALVEAVLVEVTCRRPEATQALFDPDRQPTDLTEPLDWITIHHGAVSGVDTTERECQVAKLLAVQWSVQQSKPVVLQPLRCYWLGSQDSWEAFVEQMAQVCPEVRLPAHPESWQGIDSLYAIIDRLQDVPDDAFIFCGGCQGLSTLAQSSQPENAAALLWVFGAEGRLLFSRGEWPAPVAQRFAPMVQGKPYLCGYTLPDQICVSFAQPYVPRTFDIRCDKRREKDDPTVRTLDDLSDMISMTQAALGVVRQKKPTSWRGRDPQRPPVLGIVKPNASTRSAKSAAPVAP
jgi:hypothetical protein